LKYYSDYFRGFYKGELNLGEEITRIEIFETLQNMNDENQRKRQIKELIIKIK